MQVFKLYFQVLRRYLGQMLMYVGIFMGVFMGAILPQVTKNEAEEYTQAKSDFAVFDYDNSELSHAIIEYLEHVHNLKTIETDEKEVIQDELYAMNVDCVIRVGEGFEDAFIAGDGEEYLEVFAIPDTVRAVLFEQNLNSYLSMVNTYVSAGFAVEEACEKAVAAVETGVEVGLVDETVSEPLGIRHYFFKYLSWIFVCMCVNGITSALISMDKKGVRDRIECSAYKFVRMNMEIVLGVLVTGLAICGIIIVVAFTTIPGEMLQADTILYILNAFCIMLVALAITFLISKATDKPQVISLMSNVIGLGMAFMCGIFVPMEYLSDTVIKIAHFLPAYWNVKTIQVIDNFTSREAGTLAGYMGIQILFAVAILCVGMVVARKKRVAG